ncbi:hypothetical protein [Halobaculum litoreum]|nr:hypothetical protein [Halobaculum sp. DT92]
MVLGDAPLVPVAIAGGIGLFLLAAGLREGYRTVGLWRSRPVAIGDLSAASGAVTVSGRAERLDATTRAPLTGTDCLAYA